MFAVIIDSIRLLPHQLNRTECVQTYSRVREEMSTAIKLSVISRLGGISAYQIPAHSQFGVHWTRPGQVSLMYGSWPLGGSSIWNMFYKKTQ
jgi:hypothetical protein